MPIRAGQEEDGNRDISPFGAGRHYSAYGGEAGMDNWPMPAPADSPKVVDRVFRPLAARDAQDLLDAS